MLFLEGATYELLEVTAETVIHRVETAFQLYLSVMPKAGAVSQIEQGLSGLWATELSGGCYLISLGNSKSLVFFIGFILFKKRSLVSFSNEVTRIKLGIKAFTLVAQIFVSLCLITWTEAFLSQVMQKLLASQSPYIPDNVH